MATIASNPLFMTDVDLLVGADDFAAAVSSVAFTPSASIVTKKGLKKGSVFARTTDPTWTCDVTFAQNFDDDKSLSMYLLLNQGKSVVATFRPKSGKRAITATIQITPGAIGGAIDTFADATVSFGVEGSPTVGAVVA